MWLRLESLLPLVVLQTSSFLPVLEVSSRVQGSTTGLEFPVSVPKDKETANNVPLGNIFTYNDSNVCLWPRIYAEQKGGGKWL